jgi:outer membrane receptor protein involved in Fe transport
LSYKFAELAYISFETFYESERITVYNEKTNPFVLGSLFLSYSPRFEERDNSYNFLNHINISFKTYNLFNTKYELPAALDFRQNTIPQNGINFILEASFDI